MSFVLDASLAIACFFPDERQPFSDAVRAALPNVGAAVPLIWLYEIANILHIAQASGRISTSDANDFADELLALPIEPVVQSGPEVIREIRAIADAHAISSYDAAYLHLCRALGLPLGTLDGSGRRKGLKQAAETMKLEVLTLERVNKWNAEH